MSNTMRTSIADLSQNPITYLATVEVTFSPDVAKPVDLAALHAEVTDLQGQLASAITEQAVADGGAAQAKASLVATSGMDAAVTVTAEGE